jgi:hypothetical protein
VAPARPLAHLGVSPARARASRQDGVLDEADDGVPQRGDVALLITQRRNHEPADVPYLYARCVFARLDVDGDLFSGQNVGGEGYEELEDATFVLAFISRGPMFWLWWKTLSGSYVVFTSTSRS